MSAIPNSHLEIILPLINTARQFPESTPSSGNGGTQSRQIHMMKTQ